MRRIDGDHHVMPYTAIGVPFNHFEGRDKADQRASTPTSSIEFPQRRFRERLAGFDPSAGQREKTLPGWPAARREKHLAVPEDGDRGREERVAWGREDRPEWAMSGQTCCPPLMCSSAPVT